MNAGLGETTPGQWFMWLAIIGIPPLSGFFSKEPIIVAAFEREGWTAWLYGGAALLGAGLTAFYLTRLFLLTFHGPKRWTKDIHEPHESPYIMTVPVPSGFGSPGYTVAVGHRIRALNDAIRTHGFEPLVECSDLQETTDGIHLGPGSARELARRAWTAVRTTRTFV